MHSVYGSVVRIHPYKLHIKDPSRYDELFAASNRRRDKYIWFVGKAPGNSMFGSVAADLHHKQLTALNPFFSRGSILDIEPVVQDRINKLCEDIEGHISSGEPVELHMAFMALSLDIISYHAFGRSHGLLNEPPSATQEWKTAIQGLVQAAVFAKRFPLVGDLLPKLFFRLSRPQEAQQHIPLLNPEKSCSQT